MGAVDGGGGEDPVPREAATQLDDVRAAKVGVTVEFGDRQDTSLVPFHRDAEVTCLSIDARAAMAGIEHQGFHIADEVDDAVHG